MTNMMTVHGHIESYAWYDAKQQLYALMLVEVLCLSLLRGWTILATIVARFMPVIVPPLQLKPRVHPYSLDKRSYDILSSNPYCNSHGK